MDSIESEMENEGTEYLNGSASHENDEHDKQALSNQIELVQSKRKKCDHMHEVFVLIEALHEMMVNK